MSSTRAGSLLAVALALVSSVSCEHRDDTAGGASQEAAGPDTSSSTPGSHPPGCAPAPPECGHFCPADAGCTLSCVCDDGSEGGSEGGSDGGTYVDWTCEAVCPPAPCPGRDDILAAVAASTYCSTGATCTYAPDDAGAKGLTCTCDAPEPSACGPLPGISTICGSRWSCH